MEERQREQERELNGRERGLDAVDLELGLGSGSPAFSPEQEKAGKEDSNEFSEGGNKRNEANRELSERGSSSSTYMPPPTYER